MSRSRRKPAAQPASSRAPATPRRDARLPFALVLFAVAGIVLVAGLVLVANVGSTRAAGPPNVPLPTAATPAKVSLPTAATPTQDVVTGDRPAPDFSARLLGGGSFTLSAQRGRPVLILFTASWCLPCIPEVNKMAQLHEQYGPRGLRQLVLSVDPEDTDGELDGLRRRTQGSKLLWGFDSGQQALRGYRIRATDTKVLVDQRGQIVFTSIGPTAFETLQQAVARVLP